MARWPAKSRTSCSRDTFCGNSRTPRSSSMQEWRRVGAINTTRACKIHTNARRADLLEDVKVEFPGDAMVSLCASSRVSMARGREDRPAAGLLTPLQSSVASARPTTTSTTGTKPKSPNIPARKSNGDHTITPRAGRQQRQKLNRSIDTPTRQEQSPLRKQGHTRQ